MTNRIRIVILLFAMYLLVLNLQAQEFTRIQDVHPAIDKDHSWGAAWIDIDNDGWDDLFVSNLHEFNRYYRNLGDGNFEKMDEPIICQEGGIPDEQSSGSSCWADFDNDGDLDCFVANFKESARPYNFFYINQGDGNFEKNTTSVLSTDPINSVCAAWIDYDNDGDLDLHVTNHGTFPETEGINHAILYRNDNFTFTRIANLEICTQVEYCNHPSWADYDNDGDMDLFAPSNMKTSRLFENIGTGQFGSNSASVVCYQGPGTGTGAWGDYDNDGDLDLFVTEVLGQAQLYRNNSGTFERTANIVPCQSDKGIDHSYWFDCENDGDLDLLVTRWDFYNPISPILYINENGTFVKDNSSILTQDSLLISGSALSDFDKDGDLDIYLCQKSLESGHSNYLYRNESSENNWINVECEGVQSNRSGIGTIIRVKTSQDGYALWQMRQINSQPTGGGQNGLYAHFGLGKAEVIDSLILEWPSGVKEYYLNVEVNQFLHMIEGQGYSFVSGIENQMNQKIQIHPNPSQGKVRIDNLGNGKKEIVIYSTEGRVVLRKKTNQHSLELDLSKNQDGFYYLQATSELVQIARQIIIKQNGNQN